MRKLGGGRLTGFSHLSASFLAILFVAGLAQFDLDGLNGILVDAQFRLHFWKRPHPDIVLITYDDQSSQRYYGSPKVPAVEIARVFDALERENPLSVAVIGTINERIYTDYEMQLISDSFKKLPQSMVGYLDEQSYGKLQKSPLLPNVKYLPGFISRDRLSYGADSVSRRAMLTLGGQPTVYTELTRIYYGLSEIPTFQHAHRYAQTGPLQLYINWQGPPGTYQSFSSVDVARGQYPAGTFKNKIVLFGSALKSRSSDFILTPYSRSYESTSLLEGAAHTLGTLLTDRAIYKPPAWVMWLLTLFVAVATVNMVLVFSPIRGILSVMAEILGLFLFATITLSFFNLWISLAHPIIVACFGYYLVIPYRLVNEYRQRWHYQQKSELMAQLEQLKSNFLSLVSHDLKTPIARIQGNAELLLGEANPQSGKEKDLLGGIVNTAQNLGQHVETILDLTRIENSKVPLHKTSKDINATIMEVISSKKTQADEKAIQLSTKLEPIFSFKFDSKLIRRVLANLVENAIKYSPKDSEIVLTSKEEDGWIRVSVKDHGPGISEEDKERVFTKFYRCADTEDQEKGTGLGLYLVKYFVELHKGIVELKSETGKGSEFVVSLPV